MNAASSPKAKARQFDSPLTGARLDKYMAQVFPRLSRANIQKLIEQGYILVNGQATKASQKLEQTDRITELRNLINKK